MSLDCAKCGSGVDDRHDRFWCDRCGVYFCRQCSGVARQCPHCGNERLPNENRMFQKYAILLTIFSVAMVIALASGATWWLNSTQPADKPMSPDDRDDLISMVVIVPLSMLLMAGGFYILMGFQNRVSQHYDFIHRHAGKEWTQQEKPQVGPDGKLIAEVVQRSDPLGPPVNPEWMPNGQYFRTRNQMAAFFSAALAAFVISAIYEGAIPDGYDPCVVLSFLGLLLGGVSMFVVGLMGVFVVGSLPTHIAVSSQGINLRYRSERAPRQLIRSIAWSDIQNILYVNEIMRGKANDMTNMIMKVDGTTRWIQIDRRHQRLILREWCRRNPESTTAKKYLKYVK